MPEATTVPEAEILAEEIRPEAEILAEEIRPEAEALAEEIRPEAEVLEAEIPGGTRPAAAPEVIHLEAAETTILVIQVIFPMEPSTAAMETMAARVS